MDEIYYIPAILDILEVLYLKLLTMDRLDWLLFNNLAKNCMSNREHNQPFRFVLNRERKWRRDKLATHVMDGESN